MTRKYRNLFHQKKNQKQAPSSATGPPEVVVHAIFFFFFRRRPGSEQAADPGCQAGPGVAASAAALADLPAGGDEHLAEESFDFYISKLKQIKPQEFEVVIFALPSR